MDLTTPLLNGFWSGLLAAALAVAFTAPRAALAVALVAGFAGSFGRDVLTLAGVSLPVGSFLAALLVTLIAIVLTRNRAATPAVAISGVVPLIPGTFVFAAIQSSLAVFASDPTAAAAASAAFTTNVLKALVVLAAMVLGMSIPALWRPDRY